MKESARHRIETMIGNSAIDTCSYSHESWLAAARDLLNAEREEELPWKVVYEDGVVVAAFESDHKAKQFLGTMGLRHSYTITGPDDGLPPGFAEAVAKVNPDVSWPPDASPRLVEVEWPRPTLDQMPEGEPHLVDCNAVTDHRVSYLAHKDGYVFTVDADGNLLLRCSVEERKYATPKDFTALDAPGSAPTTVGELEPGAVWLDNSVWTIRLDDDGEDTAQCAELLTGTVSYHTLSRPITGKVWRFTDQHSEQ